MSNANLLGNPLLAALSLPVYEELPARLLSEPLGGEALRGVPLKERGRWLTKIGNHFVPTSTAIDIADAIFTTIYASYEERNPCLTEIKRARYEIGAWEGRQVMDLSGYVALNPRCITLVGITGLGKSTIVSRVLSCLPQVVQHGLNNDAGWSFQKQLLWVKVDMTSDGSRLGFLMQIYRQVDAALGTDFFGQYSLKRMTVEQHMVAVSKILFECFCGALIIEEIQLRNFAESRSRDDMLMYFLRLANLGIPLILIGNPLGFQGFESFSQDVRRLTSGGRFDLWPAMSASDVDWSEFLVPGMLEFNIFDKAPDLSNPAQLLFECTGGVYDFLAKLLVQAQLIALRGGRDCLTENDILAAYNGPTLAPAQKLIRALVERDAKELSQFSDVPHLAFADRWAFEHTDGVIVPPIARRADGMVDQRDLDTRTARRPRFRTAEESYKRRRTAVARQDERNKEKLRDLSSDDLRAGGLNRVILGEFQTLRRRSPGKKSG